MTSHTLLALVFVLRCFTLSSCNHGVGDVPSAPVTYPARVLNTTQEECPSDDQRETVRAEVRQDVYNILHSSLVAGPGDRILTIANQCGEVVRVGRTGGRGNAADPGCPPGQTLNPNNMYCYWDIPTPEGGRSLDLQPGGSIVLTLPSSAGNIAWSGNIWGATGCGSGKGACETAICYDGNDITQNGHCPTYSGPVGPVTRAEFTLQNEATDFYDVTSIDGVNLPVEMKPSTQSVMSAEEAGQVGIAAEYWCGNPGGVVAISSALSNCTWSYNLTSIPEFGDQSLVLTLIAKSTDPNMPNSDCTKDSDCPQGQVCGTLQQLNDISGGPQPGLFPGKCGRFIGVLSSNGICSWAQGVQNPTTYPNNAPFNCKTNTVQPGGQFSDLYGCSGVYGISAYNCQQFDSTVCGCPLWMTIGINAPATSECECNNPTWQQLALPWLESMKEACPTSYVFPYDDPSSTFQCRNQDPSFSSKNTLGYTITFCPGGRNINRKDFQ